MQWRVSPVGYLSTEGWAIKWTFVRAGYQYEVQGEGADDGSFTATLGPAEQWQPGEYRWQCVAKRDSSRYTIDSGDTTVTPSFDLQEGGYDSRTHTEKVLDAIRAAIEGRASQPAASWSIDTPDGPRSVNMMTHEQLMKMERIYEARLDRERQEAAVAKGFGGSRLLVRLRSGL